MAATAPAPSSPPSDWLASTWAALRPPPKMTLSEWADKHYVLSVESSAAPGQWHTRPYQRGILDAITDPAVERVTWIKSARIGATLSIGAAIAFYMRHDPCPIMVVQPTVEDAEGYSKECIAPMLRDVPALDGLVSETSVKTSGQTILHKSFPGGVLGLVGANSGRGFRRVSRRVVIFDEVDGYGPSAGPDGDPVKLGEMRAADYWNRKIIACSTPRTAGASRIEDLFNVGDRRRFYVPCPTCGHMDVLRFRKRRGDEKDGGHRMVWPDDLPEEACFECSSCHLPIEERDKRSMIEAGEWRAEAPGNGTVNGRAHASFHIWAAYSMSPNATWASIASEFVAAKRNVEMLKAFVNTVLGETWHERGEAPDWERLYERRETYKIGTVPAGVEWLTAGVDVQKDRLVYEVIGWAANKENWSIDAGEIYGDTAIEVGSPGSPWDGLDALLGRTFPAELGVGGEPAGGFTIAMMAVDSGYSATLVYGYCRRHPLSRVIAVKGVPTARMLIGAATIVDVTVGGRKIQRGYRMWPVGGDIGKTELYGWLRLRIDSVGGAPPGYCHFPEYHEDFFRQLTAEHLVTITNRKKGRTIQKWEELPNRENHHLDARVYGRAAVALLGIDRLPPVSKPPTIAAPAPVAPQAPNQGRLPQTGDRKGGYWDGRGRGNWRGRRR